MDTALDRRVAVEVIRHDLVTNDDIARRFQVEARIAAAFEHPNVVTVRDFGVTGGRPFIVMELLNGTTLREGATASGAVLAGAGPSQQHRRRTGRLPPACCSADSISADDGNGCRKRSTRGT